MPIQQEALLSKIYGKKSIIITLVMFREIYMEEQFVGKFNNMENIEKATKKLDSINQWVSNCDTKSSFVLTFFGVVLTIIFTSKVGEEMMSSFSFQNADEVNQKTVFNFFLVLISSFFIISSLITFYHIYLTLKGRINDKVYGQNALNTDSNIFFRSIASKTFENFEKESNSEDKSKYLNDLNSQVFINANIVTLKFKHYNKSLLWMSISLITFLVFILLK